MKTADRKRYRKKKRRLRRWVKTAIAAALACILLFGGYIIFRIVTAPEGIRYQTVLRVPSDPDQPPVSYDRRNRRFIQSDEVLKNCLLAVSENGIDFYLIRLDDEGKMMRGWYENSGKKYYYLPENGRQCSGPCPVNDHELMFEKTGELADQVFLRSGRDYYWYENGLRRGNDGDQILFVENQKGFFFLQKERGGARADGSEIVLADGRIARFDENGFLKQEDDPDTLQFALPEASLTASETKLIPAEEYVISEREEPIRYISHRGWHMSAPENSLAAYMDSKAQGYQYVECDIQMTADQIPVLLHNPTINEAARNSDGSMLSSAVHIGSLTHEEVRQYDFGLAAGSQYEGMKITDLDVFLAYCSAAGLHPYLELKMETIDSQEDVDIIAECVRRQHMENKVTWISFSPDALRYVLNDLPDANVGWLLSTEDTAVNYMPQIIELKQNGYDVFVDAAHPLCSMVSPQCQQYGIPLGLWMVNWPDYLASMDPYVSAITTDNLLPPYE